MLKNCFVFITLLIFAGEVFAQKHGCLDECISHGGLPERCSEQCGITTHGSVNYPPKRHSQKTQPFSKEFGNSLNQQIGEDKVNNQGQSPGAAFEECYQKHCREGNIGLPLEQCIENCTKLTVLEAKGGEGGASKDEGEEDVEPEAERTYEDCFDECADQGAIRRNCEAICSDYKEN